MTQIYPRMMDVCTSACVVHTQGKLCIVEEENLSLAHNSCIPAFHSVFLEH